MALYHSPNYQTSFKTSRLSVQEKFNMDFQDGGHLGFLIKTILSTFVLQVTSILTMVQEKKFKIDFQHGCYGNPL